MLSDSQHFTEQNPFESIIIWKFLESMKIRPQRVNLN